MRPLSRIGGDPADPTIRRTLRTWALSKAPPTGGRKQLLKAAWLVSAGCRRTPEPVDARPSHLMGMIWGVVEAALADPTENSVQRALAGVAAQTEPNALFAGCIRKEGWHPYSLGIGLLTVIR